MVVVYWHQSEERSIAFFNSSTILSLLSVCCDVLCDYLFGYEVVSTCKTVKVQFIKF